MKNFLRALILFFVCFHLQSRTFAEQNNQLSLGFSFDNGFLGFNYSHSLDSSPFDLGLGLGIEGLALNMKVELFGGSFYDCKAGPTVLFGTGGLLFSENSLITAMDVNFSLWPFSSTKSGLFFKTGAQGFCLIKGYGEGGTNAGDCSGTIELIAGYSY